MLAGAIPGAWVVHSADSAVAGHRRRSGSGLTVTTIMPNHVRIDGRGYAMASGAAGGFMNTLAGIAGPAITVYAQASRWPQKTFAATLQPLFFVSGAVSLTVKELSAAEPIIPHAPWHLWAIGLVAWWRA